MKITQRCCGNCRFFDLGVCGDSDDSGLCRRNTPMVDIESGRAVWPSTYLLDWRGEFIRIEAEKRAGGGK